MPDEDSKVEEAAPDASAASPDPEAAEPEPDPKAKGEPGSQGEAEPHPTAGDAPAPEAATHATDEDVDEAAEHVEVILDDVLTTAANERDEFRDHLLRLQADFDNYRKRVQKELGEAGDKALGRFVEELLPVLDAVDAAQAHGATETDPVTGLLVDLLAKQGLERVGAQGDVFDPTLHDAVLHESGDDDVQTVAQVLRAGWRWRGRVVRPAMVKVVGG